MSSVCHTFSLGRGGGGLLVIFVSLIVDCYSLYSLSIV